MTELLTAAAPALGTVLILGPFCIPLLHRLKFGQSIRSKGVAPFAMRNFMW